MRSHITTSFITLGLLVGVHATLRSTPLANTWTLTGHLNVARSLHTATLLPNGKVLVHGGFVPRDGPSLPIASAELYDPATGIWTLTGSTVYARAGHNATLLSNGNVMVTGGEGAAGAAVEVYDPTTGHWTFTNPLRIARPYSTATLLSDGRVLVAGGTLGASGRLNSAEVYDPVTQVWTPTGDLRAGRAVHLAALLKDGKVLVTGGASSLEDSYTYELYDPTTGQWTPGQYGTWYVRDMTATATLLLDGPLQEGSVLFAGGHNYDPTWGGFETRKDVEVYQPLALAGGFEGFYAVCSLNTARERHAAARLPKGKILVAGGQEMRYDESVGGLKYFDVGTAEIYDTASLCWTPAGDPNVARVGHTMTVLRNGDVLVAGGANASSRVLQSAELYHVEGRDQQDPKCDPTIGCGDR